MASLGQDGLYAAAWAAAAALGAALVTAWALLATQHWHLRWTQDHPDHGDHKLHAEPTMRIGGLVIVAGMVLGWFFWGVRTSFEAQTPLLRMPVLAMAALLLMGLGLLEDVTRNVSVRVRLAVAAAAACLAWLWADVRVTHTDVTLLDDWMGRYAWVSLAFTVFAITGLVHAMNIIDGLNGLLAGTAILVFLSIGYVAASAQAWDVLGLSLVAGCATAGFAFFNFPRAQMFCGDSGAYLLGFVSAVLLVVLMQSHITSPWFGLALVIHPVTETLYSTWRRFRSGQSPTAPDTMHLHSLILRSVRPASACEQCANARASVWTLGLAALPMLVCVMFPKEPAVLQALIALYVAGYSAVYALLRRRVDAASQDERTAPFESKVSSAEAVHE